MPVHTHSPEDIDRMRTAGRLAASVPEMITSSKGFGARELTHRVEESASQFGSCPFVFVLEEGEAA